MSKIKFIEEQLPSFGQASPIWRAQGQFTFANGWTVSIVYGSHCYCDCRTSSAPTKSCLNAEVAVIKPDGTMTKFAHSGDDVRGYSSADDIAGIMQWTASQPKESE